MPLFFYAVSQSLKGVVDTQGYHMGRIVIVSIYLTAKAWFDLEVFVSKTNPPVFGNVVVQTCQELPAELTACFTRHRRTA